MVYYHAGTGISPICVKQGTVVRIPPVVLALWTCLSKNCDILKQKSVPLQAWSGPECSRKLRFPDCITTAQDGGKFVSLTHRPRLPAGNVPGTHFC